MSASFPAWLLLLGLLPAELQTRALPPPRPKRLDLPTIPRIEHTVIIDSKLSTRDHHFLWSTWGNKEPTERDRHFLWRSWGHKESPTRSSESLFHQNATTSVSVWQRRSRDRRHANSGGGGGGGGRSHGHLMRVGCVLGTCQVQNLSHRLYQLIGQSGREDSSPIHPRSPHSYG